MKSFCLRNELKPVKVIFVHSQTFHNREPGLSVDNTVNQLLPAWTYCLRIWTCLYSPLHFDSGLIQTEPGMWECGYCDDGIHHVPCFLEMMALLPPTSSPRCDPETNFQKRHCCHIQQWTDFSKELHHLVNSLVYKLLLGWAQYKCMFDFVLGSESTSDPLHVDS